MNATDDGGVDASSSSLPPLALASSKLFEYDQVSVSVLVAALMALALAGIHTGPPLPRRKPVKGQKPVPTVPIYAPVSIVQTLSTIALHALQGLLFTLAMPIVVTAVRESGVVPVAAPMSSFTAAVLGAIVYLVVVVVPTMAMPVDAAKARALELQEEEAEKKALAQAAAAAAGEGEAPRTYGAARDGLLTDEAAVAATLGGSSDDAEDMKWDLYEPGPAFFRLHFLSWRTLLTVALVGAAAWAIVAKLEHVHHVPLLALTALAALLTVGTVAWPSIPFEYRYPVMYAGQMLVAGFVTANFVVFWALPIFGLGQLYKQLLQRPARWLFSLVDESTLVRRFGAKFVYSQERYTDFFATTILTVISVTCWVSFVFYYQLTHGELAWWVIFAYYCSWVGPGGRVMAAAYTFAHKEGHFRTIYQPWFRRIFGNIFENGLGVFFGNVPHQFSTAHNAIHHRLDAGWGDTFYMWDIDRTKFSDYCLYLYRVLLYMSGITNLAYFWRKNEGVRYNKLLYGARRYWLIVPGVILAITGSWSFLFFFYVQPLICMSYFLTLINISFHGYLEFNEDGTYNMMVASTCIVDGHDDSYGEDDHLLHHAATDTYHADLAKYREKLVDVFRENRSPIFKTYSIVENSALLLLEQWDRIYEHFVDYGTGMSKEDMIALMKVRAKRKEVSHRDYSKWFAEGCPEPRPQPYLEAKQKQK